MTKLTQKKFVSLKNLTSYRGKEGSFSAGVLKKAGSKKNTKKWKKQHLNLWGLIQRKNIPTNQKIPLKKQTKLKKKQLNTKQTNFVYSKLQPRLQVFLKEKKEKQKKENMLKLARVRVMACGELFSPMRKRTKIYRK